MCVVWAEICERHVLRAQRGEAILSVDGPAGAGSSVLHGPRVGVTVPQSLQHTLTWATIHGRRFGNGLRLLRTGVGAQNR